jgi:hypothetical protein
MENSRFPEIELGMNGNYSNLDIAPIEFVQPFIAPEDTFRNVRIQNEKYMIERMDWLYDAKSGILKPDISLRHVTTGSAGVTIPIPDLPDDNGFSVPNFQIPSLPAFNFPASEKGITDCAAVLDCLAGYGIGPNVNPYSIVVTRAAPLDVVMGAGGGPTEIIPKMTYASNYSIYSVSENRINFINDFIASTGTVSVSYTLQVIVNDNEPDGDATIGFGAITKMFDNADAFLLYLSDDSLCNTQSIAPVGYTDNYLFEAVYTSETFYDIALFTQGAYVVPSFLLWGFNLPGGEDRHFKVRASNFRLAITLIP